MRIISGTKKSISIRAPKNLPVRPTTDKVKESLFNIISDVEITNSDFSQTGHYGIWIKSIGLNNIDSVKNTDFQILDCNFENTGGSGFVPNKSKNILVQNSLR